jgi:hypothetical protein
VSTVIAHGRRFSKEQARYRELKTELEHENSTAEGRKKEIL